MAAGASILYLDIPPDFEGVYPLSCGLGEAFGRSAPPPAGSVPVLLYMQEGKGDFRLGGRAQDYRAGDVLSAYRAKELLINPATETRYLFISLENPGNMLDTPGLFLRESPDGALERRFESICLLPQKGTADIWGASAAVYGLLMELHARRAAARGIRSALVLDAMRLMQRDYAFLSGVDELARRMGVDRSHLIRRFAAEAGISPGKYLQSIRLEQAKLLLKSRDYSIDLVANMTGYSGANYFCKVFRRETGESPGAYRSRAAALGATDYMAEFRLREIEDKMQV